jgi:hypothetical protein
VSEDQPIPRGTTIRLEPGIRARLDAYRTAERRSINQALNHLLDVALTDYEKQESQP